MNDQIKTSVENTGVITSSPASCSAADLASELTELTNRYIELGLSPEQAASVFAHAADSALGCLKWEPTKTRIAHDNIQKAVILLESHWMPKPPNTVLSVHPAKDK
jgi:hypothetical protein